MGSEHFYPEEAPARRVRVDPFQIDEVPVTNAAFAAFVAATGHVTRAENGRKNFSSAARLRAEPLLCTPQ